MGEMKDKYFDYYGYNHDPTSDEYPEVHVCRFPDTGMYLSWCPECGEEAYFSTKLGKYSKYKD
jgi:hypothetical protein